MDVHRLQKVAMDGNWEAAEGILHRNPELRTEKIQRQGMTALLLAAKCGRSAFVKKFVRILNAEELLEMRDNDGLNVLHHAAVASDVGAARAIVDKNPRLAWVDSERDSIPMFYAALWRHPSKSQEMLEYLYSVTDPSFYQSPRAQGLVVAVTASGCYGIALSILEENRTLAAAKTVDKKWSILHILATQPWAFKSPRKIFWLYPWKIKESLKQYQKHKEARDLVNLVCWELASTEVDEMDYFLPAGFHAILQLATVHGTDELVEICLGYFPDLIWYASNIDQRMLLHVAVEHRRVNIFNMVMRLVGEYAGTYARAEVEGKNNILHLAANLAPTLQLHSVPGPAFQMQRELQWFKVTIIYRSEFHEGLAKSYRPPIIDICTPRACMFHNLLI